jgi:hypothetical protein
MAWRVLGAICRQWQCKLAVDAVSWGIDCSCLLGLSDVYWCRYNGLATVSVAFPEFNGANDWYAKSAAGVEDDMASNVYPDGIENEQTSSYHKANSFGTRLLESWLTAS